MAARSLRHTGDDTPVTRRELALQLTPLQDDLAELKADVKSLVEGRWLGPRAAIFLNTTAGRLLTALVFAAMLGVVAWVRG